MHNLNKSDERMRDVLANAKTIAIVGHSDKFFRTSYQIANYLRRAGYKVFPVNPTVDEIDGEKCYDTLRDIPEEIDIVNIFRRSEHVAEIVREAIAVGAKAIWTQLGVVDMAARDAALAAGLDVAMDLCIKVEHARLRVDYSCSSGKISATASVKPGNTPPPSSIWLSSNTITGWPGEYTSRLRSAGFTTQTVVPTAR